MDGKVAKIDICKMNKTMYQQLCLHASLDPETKRRGFQKTRGICFACYLYMQMTIGCLIQRILSSYVLPAAKSPHEGSIYSAPGELRLGVPLNLSDVVSAVLLAYYIASP